MTVSKKAIVIAKEKEQEAKDFDYCVEWKVCPKCASYLNYSIKSQIINTSINYTCSK